MKQIIHIYIYIHINGVFFSFFICNNIVDFLLKQKMVIQPTSQSQNPAYQSEPGTIKINPPDKEKNEGRHDATRIASTVVFFIYFYNKLVFAILKVLKNEF